jgi:ATP-dependent helicase/nuclease subunit A
VRSPFADEKHFRRGRLVHRLLETLPDLDADARGEAARRYLARPTHALATDEIDAIVAETLALFDDPSCAPLFQPGSLAEVPLTGVLGSHVVSGQVDRLAIGAREILVVDYKTNRSPPRDPPAIYVKQRAAYRALLRAIYPGRRVRCFLLWTVVPALAELDHALLDAAAPAAAPPHAPENQSDFKRQ